MRHEAPMPHVPETEAGAPDKNRVNPLVLFLGYQLRRASLALLGDLTSTIADLSLTVTELSLLLVVEANPDITQSEIGRMLAIQRANMAPLTALLVQRHLVGRTATTGRAHGLRLTEAGAAMAAICRTRIAAHEDRFLSKLKRNEQDAIMHLLRRIWQDR
jgi:DNA-binding MarR family transcriptional regulator